jgi:hypothetical protein
MTKDRGEVVYLGRAFQQDGDDAMKGDIVRGLVELITNADDAYNAKGGKIDIVVGKAASPFEYTISVHDQAGGLTAADLKKHFTRLGEENSKFLADKGTRGLFGRGAKDVAAFGKARFETIHQGVNATLDLNRDGTWESEDFSTVSETALQNCRLAEGENGLTATIFISPKMLELPSSVKLVSRLESHVQLRDLLNRNTVTLRDYREKAPKTLNGLKAAGQLIFDKDLKVAGYDVPIHLQIFEMETKQQGSVDEFSRQGLVVSGKGAAYANTFFGLDNRPEAGWFCGHVEAPEIRDIAAQGSSNPGINAAPQLVSRQREGLMKNHPYYRSLATAVESVLRPIFEDMAEREGGQRKASEQLRKKLETVSTALAQTLNQILKEDESEALPNQIDDGNNEFGFTFIPPRRNVVIGETISLTLRAPNDFNTAGIELKIQQLGVHFSLVNNTTNLLTWRDHPRLPLKQTTVQVMAKIGGSADLLASSPTHETSCSLVAVEALPPVDELVEELAFDRANVSISPTRARRLLLMAPADWAGEKIKIATTGIEVFTPNEVILKSTKTGLSSQAIVRVQASAKEGSAKVTATLDAKVAECAVHVKESGNGSNPIVEIDVSGQDNPQSRVESLPENGKLVIRLYAKHPSLTRVFGKYKEEKAGFEHDDSDVALAAMSEIVAQQLANYATERHAENRPDLYLDPSSVFFKQRELIPRFLLIVQALVSGK